MEKLRAAGHELVPFTPPRIDEAMSIFFALIASGGDHVQAELDGEKIADSLAKLSLQVCIAIVSFLLVIVAWVWKLLVVTKIFVLCLCFRCLRAVCNS